MKMNPYHYFFEDFKENYYNSIKKINYETYFLKKLSNTVQKKIEKINIIIFLIIKNNIFSLNKYLILNFIFQSFMMTFTCI